MTKIRLLLVLFTDRIILFFQIRSSLSIENISFTSVLWKRELVKYSIWIEMSSRETPKNLSINNLSHRCSEFIIKNNKEYKSMDNYKMEDFGDPVQNEHFV